MRFSELPLTDAVYQGIQDAGFVDCTDVQTRTLENTLQGRDVCVQSQTGTGKTAAYLVSVFQLMLQQEDLKDRTTVIIAPTRELAVQIEREAKLLGAHVPLRIGCFYGGVGYGQQEKLIAQGIDVIIGTPGRLIDFNQSKKLDFSRVGIVIIDEADRLFDMGFYPDIRRMLRKMPARENRMSMLFSATLSVRARNIAWEYMHDPVEIEINPEKVTVDGISQILYHVSKREKFRLLLGVLRREQPDTAIVFTNTKRAAEEVSRRLEMNGYPSTFIMGDLPQRKRLRVIDDIKAGKVKLLVATDVAARGLHIDDLDMVVNYDLPEDRESYVHRIGRTARAGKSGRAVSLADEQYVFNLEGIESFLGSKIPAEQVRDELLAEDSTAGVRIQLGTHYLDERGRKSSHSGGRDRKRQEADHRYQKRSQDVKEVSQRREQSTAKKSHEPQRRSTRGKDTEAGNAAIPRAAKHHGGQAQRPGHRNSMEERLEYYRKKYGEDFSHVVRKTERGAQKGPASTNGVDRVQTAGARDVKETAVGRTNRSIWDRITGMFRGKGQDEG